MHTTDRTLILRGNSNSNPYRQINYHMQHLYYPKRGYQLNAIIQSHSAITTTLSNCVGDFNARSIAWGDTENNKHGDIIEDLVLSSKVCVLNTGSNTHANKHFIFLSDIFLTKIAGRGLYLWKWSFSVLHSTCYTNSRKK